MKKVSFIVSSFNKLRFLPETIDSVLNQDHADVELLVIDDHSTDGTIDWLKKRQREKPSRDFQVFILDENKGANFCRNLGLKHASGEYIIFLDGDDLVDRNCAGHRIEFMQHHAHLDFAVFSMGVFKKQPGDFKSPNWIPSSTFPLADFLSHKIPWSIMQPIWKRKVLVDAGGFDEEFLRLQDIELHTRILFNKSIRFSYSVEVDCHYRIDEERATYSASEFYTRALNAVDKYCGKFYQLAKDNKIEKQLLGTLIKVYLQIIFAFKNGKIQHDDFILLEKRLFSTVHRFDKVTYYLRMLKLTKRINLLSIKIKGANWFLEKLIKK